MIQRIGYRDVDLTISKINTSNLQSRQENVYANVDDLVQSIESQGLFSPILLIELGNNEYDLIAGQRRKNAYQKLAEKNPKKFKKIPTFLYKNNMEDWERKGMSNNENFNQEPMSEIDKTCAVTVCYNQFDSIPITSQKTGMPEYRVRRFVKYERLPQVLKNLNDKGKITLETAISTADVFGFHNSNIDNISEEEIEKVAIEIETLTAKQKIILKSAKKEKPDEPIYDLIKRIQSLKRQTNLIEIKVTSDVYSRVEDYAKTALGKNMTFAVEELIEKGLDSIMNDQR